MQQKGCYSLHGEYLEGCPVCERWRYDERYASLRNGDASPPADKTRVKSPLSCRHRSEKPTGETVTCVPCGGGVKLKLYGCAVHGTCTLGKRIAGHGCCDAKCEERDSPATTPPGKLGPVTRGRYEWVTSSRMAQEALGLVRSLPQGLSGVAGIPRSGMMPASLIASHLHLPLYELTRLGKLNRLGNGTRGVLKDSGPILVIDDTVFSGTAMRRARTSLARLGREALFAAVYCRPGMAQMVDFHARLLESPHLLEWNLVNCAVLAGNSMDPVFGKGVALDLDGVIVHDMASAGPPLSPYLVPRSVVAPLIATGRPESTRPETEALLRSVGAKWARLEMLPNDIALTPEAAARHKARHYAESGCGFFVESDPVQADLIHTISGKPVICPVAGKVWH